MFHQSELVVMGVSVLCFITTFVFKFDFSQCFAIVTVNFGVFVLWFIRIVATGRFIPVRRYSQR